MYRIGAAVQNPPFSKTFQIIEHQIDQNKVHQSITTRLESWKAQVPKWPFSSSVNITQCTQWLTCITTSSSNRTTSVSRRSISQVCTWLQVAPKPPRLEAISGQSASFYNGWPKLLALLVWQPIPSPYPLGHRWPGHCGTVTTRSCLNYSRCRMWRM